MTRFTPHVRIVLATITVAGLTLIAFGLAWKFEFVGPEPLAEAPGSAAAVAVGAAEVSSPSATESVSPSPTPGASLTPEVYSNVVQSAGEVDGGHELTRDTDPTMCLSNTSAALVAYRESEFAGGDVLAMDPPSIVQARNGSVETRISYDLTVRLDPERPLSLRVMFDGCLPVTVQSSVGMGTTTVTLTSASGQVVELPPLVGQESRAQTTFTPEITEEWVVEFSGSTLNQVATQVFISQEERYDTSPIGVCEVTIDGDFATYDASKSYDQEGDPFTISWWSFDGEDTIADGSTVDISAYPEGWYVAACVSEYNGGQHDWMFTEVWLGPGRPHTVIPDEPVTFAPARLGDGDDIECSVTIGPEGLNFAMPTETVSGLPLVRTHIDLPFGEESTAQSGTIAIPPDIGMQHHAYCRGWTADGFASSSSISIELESEM